MTADRYEADWEMVERGWRTHVLGGREASRARRMPSAHRAEQPGIGDQYLPSFVVGGGSDLTLSTRRGHLFNFRGDRAIEISRAFDTPEGAPFPFDRRSYPMSFSRG